MKAETLKKSILQYAMQGKLVTQNPNDEPASKLLKRIKAEKEQLIKDGKIKKEKPLPPITEDEIPYELPQGWEWCRVNDIGVYKKGPFGSALTKKIFVPKGTDTVKVYEQKNAIQKDCLLGEYYISKEYYEKSMKSFTVSSGDVIVSCAGTIGETYIMPRDIELGIINQALMRMTITKEIDLKYFLMYFDVILKRDSKTYSKGSVIKNIPPFEIFKPMLVPLPPLAEQQRIVERLEEILPLVEEYGKNEEILSEMNKNLPKQIRRSILQYAVQGKLVPQNPNDEPASKLLKRIKAEKEQLIKDGKIKKEKPLPPITEDEIPFQIPNNWCFIRLGDLCSINPRNIFNDDLDVGFVPMNLINDGYSGGHKYENKKWKEIKNGFTHFKTGDVIVAKITPCFQNRKSTIISELPNLIGAGTTELHVIRDDTQLLDMRYILLIVKTEMFIRDGVKNFTGTAGQQRVSKDYVSNYIIPLPPLAEQQRIVEKVEELMKIVNKLGV